MLEAMSYAINFEANSYVEECWSNFLNLHIYVASQDALVCFEKAYL